MAATNTDSKAIEKELEALKEDLASVKNDLRDLVDSLVGRAKSETEDITRNARKNIRYGVNSVEDSIEKNPFTTVLIALGVGMILGKVLSR
jgi:ElaB/YqjD/DUF883 family membrane-anchored ribosome-binding protein